MVAGDWIKMRIDLRDDPAVFCMADKLKTDRDRVVGLLHHFWCWCSSQIENACAFCAHSVHVDELVGVAGFAQALEEVGWLEDTDDGIVIPKWDRHLSESAKRRAVNAARMREKRAHSVRKVCAEKCTREEKSRDASSSSARACELVTLPTGGSVVAPASDVEPGAANDARLPSPSEGDWIDEIRVRLNVGIPKLMAAIERHGTKKADWELWRKYLDEKKHDSGLSRHLFLLYRLPSDIPDDGVRGRNSRASIGRTSPYNEPNKFKGM